jgi:hypothetical protein
MPSNWLSNSGIAARRLAGDLTMPLPMFPVGCVSTVRIKQDLSDNGITRKELEAENRRLKQGNKRLEIEREILKKAAAFFAKESS